MRYEGAGMQMAVAMAGGIAAGDKSYEEIGLMTRFCGGYEM
jgi:hypothetical protein